MVAYLTLTRAWLISFFRQRQQVFWSFFFPVFFIILFGSIFGRSDGDSSVKFKIGVVAPANLPPQYAWAPKVFHNVGVLDAEDGALEHEQQQLRESKIRALVVFPADFAERRDAGKPAEVRTYYDASQPQVGQTVTGIINQVLGGINQGLSGAPAALTIAKPEAASAPITGPKRSGGIDFLLPGILAMSIMQLGLFAAIPIVNLREKGILKRLRATPLSRSAIVGSQVSYRLIIEFIQTLTIILLGMAMFHFQMLGSWPALLAVVIFGTVTFICMGAVLAAVAKTQETAVSMVQMVNLPMMFLSGMFYPLEVLPQGLRSVVVALPATHLASLTRHVMVGANPSYPVATSLAVMAAWLVVALAVAAKTFRWD